MEERRAPPAKVSGRRRAVKAPRRRTCWARCGWIFGPGRGALGLAVGAHREHQDPLGSRGRLMDPGRGVTSEAEIAELYARHGHALYRRCLTLVGSEEDARELLQEVFCQFWRGRERFEGRSAAFTYLYRIATNLSIDRLRRRRTAGHQEELDERRGDGLPTRGDAPGSPERRTAAAAELAELTAGLDDETLAVAVMSHIDGMTQDEIAAALGLSRRTIGKRLKRFIEHTRARAAGRRAEPPGAGAPQARARASEGDENPAPGPEPAPAAADGDERWR